MPTAHICRKEREKRDAQMPDEGPRHQAQCEREKARQEAGDGQPEEFQDEGACGACVRLLRAEPARDVQPRCRFGAKCRQKHLDQPGLQRVPI